MLSVIILFYTEGETSLMKEIEKTQNLRDDMHIRKIGNVLTSDHHLPDANIRECREFFLANDSLQYVRHSPS